MPEREACASCSSWASGSIDGVPVVERDGPPPEYLYHLTPDFRLRGIRRTRELRPSSRGRGGFSAAGAVEGGVSFTEDVRSFVEKHPYAWNWRVIRVRAEDVPGAKPVVYVGGRTLGEQARGMNAVRDAGGEARSMHFVKEREWWTEDGVPLVRGRYSVSLPMGAPGASQGS